MQYKKTIPYTGSSEKMQEAAEQTFLPLGFTVEKKTFNALEFVSSGSFVKQMENSLFGVSKLSISRTGSEWVLEADLGILGKMMKGLAIFIILGLLMMTGLFYFVLLGQASSAAQKLFLCFLGAVFFFDIAFIFLLTKSLKSKVARALDRLMDAMVALAREV